MVKNYSYNKFTTARSASNSGTLRDGKAGWIRITAFNRYTQLTFIQARVADNNIVEVTTSNVASFELTPPKVLFSDKKDIQLVLNGELLSQAYDIDHKMIYPQKAPPQSFPVYKTAQRSGPIKACFRGPFLAVYGTTNPRDLMYARQFVSQWQEYADGIPPMKEDKEVTPEDMEKYNLILFGTPDSYLLLAKIADKLPLNLSMRVIKSDKSTFPAKKSASSFAIHRPFRISA